MRLLTIQLLLLGTQLISAALGDKCDAANIKGARISEYKYTSGVLKCNGDNNEIEYSGTRYSTLKCVDDKGWKDDAGQPLAPPISDISDIKITCQPKAATPAQECVQTLIAGFVTAKMNYDTNKLTCTEGGNVVEYTPKTGAKQTTKTLECVKNDEWKADSGKIGIKSKERVTVACVIDPCSGGLIQRNGVKYDTTPKFKLSCGKKVMIDGKYYDSLTCTESAGWTDSIGTQIKLSTDKFTADCAAIPVPPCTVTDARATVANNKLTCKPAAGSHPAYIDMSGKIYTHLSCDGTKWTDVDGKENIPAATPLAVTCKDYCKSSISTELAYEEDTPGSGTFKISCITNFGEIKRLFHGQSGSATQVKDVTCSLVDGWKEGVNVLDADSTKEMQLLECKEGCTAANDFDAEAKKTSIGTGKQFKCLNEGHDSPDKNAIQLDGTFVNSHLNCDADNGWTDVANKKLADAFTKVKITCGKVMCDAGKDTPCGNSEIKKKLPHGHICEEGKAKRFPGAASDDPNILKCNGNKIMYDFKSAKFFEKPLRCKSEEKSYAFLDDPNQETVLSGEHKLFCLQKRCNKCQSLPDNNLSPTAGVNQLPVQFIPGEVDECAKSECRSDLWMLEYKDKISDASVTEEYAGKVECSSEMATDSQWVIDGETKVEKGICIDKIDKCTIAAALNTQCEAPWTEKPFECTPLTLDDTATSSCPTGNLYYKAKGDYAFYQAVKIACDQGAGWKVTIAKDGGGGMTEDVNFGRGGTVICANNNPSPVTTTTPPTTTTPFVDPCGVCPKELYSCDKCSEKEPKFNPTSDNEKCQAMALASETSFETEKEGLVKGKLSCDKSEKIWKSEDGKEVGKFALPDSGDADTAENTGLIIGGAVGGVVFLIAILAVIFYVLVGRKKAPKEQDEDTKRKMLEEGKKRKKTKDGDNNDEILDEVAVDAPAEIKL